jgi:hypothetical protein
MNIAIPVFDGLTSLDAIGPYEALSNGLGLCHRPARRERGFERETPR